MLTKRERWTVFGIALAAWLVRVAICTQGGQFWSQDESHLWYPSYSAVGAIAGAIGPVPWDVVQRNILSQQAHAGYRLVSFALSSVAFMAMGQSVFAHQWVLAALNALAAPLLLVVVAGVVRRATGRGDMAVNAALFLALSTSLTQWCRHLLPYDWGLLLAWCALLVGMGEPRWGRGVSAGALLMAAFLTYLGTGTTCALVAGILFWRAVSYGQSRPELRRDVELYLGGLGAGLVLVAWLPTLLPWPDVPFWTQQGRFLVLARLEGWGSSYAEGWRVPFLYLWATEGAALLPVAWYAWHRDARPLTYAAVVLYVLIVLPSLLGTGVVVGRGCRQLWPWFAAAAGIGWTVRPMWERSLALSIMVAAYAVSLHVQLVQQFPGALDARWKAEHGALAYRLTVTGPDTSFADQGAAGAKYVGVNVQPNGFLWPVTGQGVDGVVGSCVLESYPHPLAWPGMWYEGFRPGASREALRNLTMRLERR